MRRSWIVPAVSLSWLALCATASATVMTELTLDEMVRSADAIVVGVVEHSGVRLGERNGALEPETITTIRVREWLAGSGGQTVQIRELGGVWQGGGVRYEGTPEYRAGEQVVVFLERRTDGRRDLRTLGMVQGKFLVRPGVPGTPDTVRRELDGIAFVRWVDGRQAIQAPGEQPSMQLDAFLAYVRQARTAWSETPPNGPLGGGR